MKTRLIIDWQNYQLWYEDRFDTWNIDPNLPVYYNGVSWLEDRVYAIQDDSIWGWHIPIQFVLSKESIEN